MFLYYVKKTTTSYTLSRSAVAVDEGMQFTFTLTTTGLDNGTTVPYTITGISSGDVGGASLTGVFTIANNVGTVVLTATADLTTEGYEEATLSLDGGMGSLAIGINDTSTTVVFVDAVELGDPYWNNVTSHITFDDNVTDQKIPSRVWNNSGVGYSASPAKFGKAGVFNGGYLRCYEDMLSFGTSDFAVEMWIYPTNTSAYTEFIRSGNSGLFLFRSTPTRQLQFESNIGSLTTGTNVINLNTWYHVAITRSGDTFRIFRNGSQLSTTTLTGSISTGAAVTEVGAVNNGSEPFIGNMDELRITNGVARYTGAFTAPRRRFPSYQSTDPYALNVEALLPFNNGTILNDLTGRVVNYWTGTATSDSSDFVMGNGSASFNGNTIMRIGSDSSLGLGSGNFTIEYYAKYLVGSGVVLCQTLNTNIQELFLVYATGNQVFLYLGDGSAQYNIASSVPFSPANLDTNWHHYAIVRTGTSIKLYFDGALVGTITTSATFASTTSPVLVGGRNVSGSPSQMFTGKIDGLRITKAARYTAAFTPPTVYDL